MPWGRKRNGLRKRLQAKGDIKSRMVLLVEEVVVSHVQVLRDAVVEEQVDVAGTAR